MGCQRCQTDRSWNRISTCMLLPIPVFCKCNGPAYGTDVSSIAAKSYKLLSLSANSSYAPMVHILILTNCNNCRSSLKMWSREFGTDAAFAATVKLRYFSCAHGHTTWFPTSSGSSLAVWTKKREDIGIYYYPKVNTFRIFIRESSMMYVCLSESPCNSVERGRITNILLVISWQNYTLTELRLPDSRIAVEQHLKMLFKRQSVSTDLDSGHIL